MLAESEVNEELICEISVSEFKSRRSTQLEGAAKWLATGQRKPGYGFRRGNAYGDAVRAIPPPSVIATLSNFFNDNLSIGQNRTNDVNSHFFC